MKNETMNTTTEPKVVKKQVKHTFTREEREQISSDLVHELSRMEALEAEMKQTKSSYQAKIDEAQSKVGVLKTNHQAGFEFRMVECRVVYRPKDKKKDFFVVDTNQLAATEDMTQEDFQYDMMISDSKFEAREEIELWAERSDRGAIIIAKAGDKWVAAIRAKLGVHTLSEQLSATKTFKARVDALKKTVDRLTDWIDSVSPGAAEGFAAKFNKVIEAQKERVE